MASQPEQPTYDPGVYQYEVTDPIQGGIGGVANLPLLNLADRTAWLKQQLGLLINGSLIPPTVAPLNGPAFTGSVTAPNVAPGDDSTLIANTDFVQTAKHGLVVVPVGGNQNVTLTQAQWGVGILVFTGVLTSGITVIFPSKAGSWIVENATTGGFPLQLRTVAGGGLVIPQAPSQFNAIWCDGTSVYPQVSPYLLSLTYPEIVGALGFTPVQQGGGYNQSGDKVYIGWDLNQSGHLRWQVNSTDEGDLANLSDFTLSAGIPGYLTLPTAAGKTFIIQWGSGAVPAYTTLPVSYYLAFPNTALIVAGNYGAALQAGAYANGVSPNPSAPATSCLLYNGDSIVHGISFIAMGY